MSTSSTRDHPVAPDGRPRPRRPGYVATPALADAVAVLGVYTILGLAGAVLWWALHDPAVFTATADGELAMGDVELAKRFAVDGWYSVIAAVAGLVSGTAMTWWRGRDPLLTAALVLVGSLVAAGVMSLVGGWLGAPDPAALTSIRPGAMVPAPLRVDAPVCHLVWPVTALIGSLIVLWAPPPDSS